MRLIFAALAAALAASGYYLPYLVADLPPTYEPYRNLALIALAIWVLIEAMVAAARKPALSKEAIQGLREDKSLLETARNDALANTRQLAATLATTTKEASELRRALEDDKARMARLDQELKTHKAKSADVEIVNLLALLQQKGRLIDFLMDDVTKYPDAQIGAAARVVHQGCSAVLQEYFDIKPIHQDREGSQLTIDKDYDARRYRLLGRVAGEPPFKGRLLHKGWLTAKVKLPELTDSHTADNSRGVIAPAEVELN